MEEKEYSKRLIAMMGSKKAAKEYAVLREIDAEDSQDLDEQNFWSSVINELDQRIRMDV